MSEEQKKRWFIKSFLLLVFLTGVFLPGAKLFAADASPDFSFDSAQTGTPVSVVSTPKPGQLTSYGGSLLEAFIQVPFGVVEQPYVILSAVQLGSSSGVIEIKGSFSDKSFVCESTPCMVPITQSDNIRFRAYSTSGDVSDEVLSTVAVNQVEDGFVVQLSSVNKYTTFGDTCRATWNLLPNPNPPFWAEFPQFYFQLNTQRTLHYLTAKLIVAGIVDVSACTDGGVSRDLTWPTGCGLAEAKDEMINWQNQYDAYIWTASKDVGIPPKILKTLIQTESQFWPANKRFYVDEYGLGQITQLGLDVLLRDDPALFESFCPKVLDYCNTFYQNLSPADQALVRGALLSSLDATCLTCEYGFDFTQAGQSIFYIASLLEADCGQTKSILDSFDTFSETEYEDYWKFTLFTYHSGIVCFHSAVETTYGKSQDMTWENLSENTSCVDGKKYVDGIWGELVSFDLYLYQANEMRTTFAETVFEEAPSPTPEPTLAPSSAQVSVKVLLEATDGVIEPLDNIIVSLVLEDGTNLMKETINGEASFDMRGYPAHLDTTVSLPGLYRSERFELPLQGVKEIVFVFASPALPPSLP